MAKPKTEFSVNQKVVYPSQGVGKITEIFKKDFNNEPTYYYKIYLEVSDMNVMVPVSRSKDLGIRAIVSKDEAQTALNSISDDFEPPTSDWKLRYQMNLDLLKKGTIGDIAAIVRCLYHRSKVKELPILERKQILQIDPGDRKNQSGNRHKQHNTQRTFRAIPCTGKQQQ